MLRYFKRNLPIAVAAGLTSILTQLSTPVAAMLEQRLVDNIIARDFQGFSNQLLYSGLLVLVSALLYWLSARTQKQFQVRFEESLRNDLFEKAMSQPHSLFQQTDTAQQMSFIRNEASVVSTNLTRPVFILVGYFPMAAAVLLIMFHYSPLLALLAIACAAISILPPLSFNRRLSTQLADKLTRDADLTFQLKETLGGHETISAFQALPQFLCRFFSSSRAAADAAYRLEVMAALLENAAYVIQKFVWFVTFLVAGRMAVHQQISVGTLMMFVTFWVNSAAASPFTPRLSRYCSASGRKFKKSPPCWTILSLPGSVIENQPFRNSWMSGNCTLGIRPTLRSSKGLT